MSGTGFPGGPRTRLPMQENEEVLGRSLGWEDPLEKDMATHSSIRAWRIPRTEEPGGLQSKGSKKVRHNRSHLACMHMSGPALSNRTFCVAGNVLHHSPIWQSPIVHGFIKYLNCDSLRTEPFISLNFNLRVKHFHCLFVKYYFNNYILCRH